MCDCFGFHIRNSAHLPGVGLEHACEDQSPADSRTWHGLRVGTPRLETLVRGC